MSRPSRSERFGGNTRSRPKRRAAATNYLFKYQLAGDPSRIEENALKKALQESLEEQKSSSPMTAGAAVIASKQAGRNKSKQNNKTNDDTKPNHREISQRPRLQHVSNDRATLYGRSTMNSSTNSSDVSKASNNSSASTTTTNSSSEVVRDTSSTNGRGGSSGGVASAKRLRSSATQETTELNPAKRAKSTTNGHCNIKSSLSKSFNKQKCDKEEASVLAESPLPPLNRSVHKTYSRAQQPKPTNGHSTQEHRQNVNISPRTSTPIADGPQTSLNTSTDEPSVSKGTQTAAVSQRKKAYLASASPVHRATINGTESVDKSPETVPPVQNHYLKLKRESKNYAYAKMTAIKVNESKSPFSGVARTSSSSLQSSAKSSIPKPNPCATSHGVDNHTAALSKNHNQSNVNMLKKRIVQGSWSLLGVPEEKILYLRDDEPPRRLICYPAIKHVEGDVIQVRDSVLLRSGAKQTDLPYIAKICAFWQDAETGGVLMSLYWYYRPEHIEDGRKPHHLIDEIFASRHRDVDSVECIEDKCYVLTFNEYCRYRKRCKMDQVNATWSLTDVTIPVSNETYPRRNRIPDSNVNPELVFCCRQIYDSRNRRLLKNPSINSKYGHI